MAKCVKNKTERTIVKGTYSLSNYSEYVVDPWDKGTVNLYFGRVDGGDVGRLSYVMGPKALREFAQELIDIAEVLEERVGM